MAGAVRATTIADIGAAIKPGLHSPVLLHGTMPIVDGMATSFDALYTRCASPLTGCRCSRRLASLRHSVALFWAILASTSCDATKR